jgi:hypothetical protein
VPFWSVSLNPKNAGNYTDLALKAVVLAGPDPAVGKIERLRIVDLCQWVKERWGVSYSETGMLRLL